MRRGPQPVRRGPLSARSLHEGRVPPRPGRLRPSRCPTAPPRRSRSSVARGRGDCRARGRERPRGVGPADPADAGPRPEQRRARAIFRAIAGRPAREGQRGVRPPRVAADRLDEFRGNRRRQDPLRRDRRQGMASYLTGNRVGFSPAAGQLLCGRKAARSRPITTATLNSGFGQR